MNDNKRKGMPTHKALYEFWSNKTGISNVKTSLQARWTKTTCMACANTYFDNGTLDRAHIVPLWLGGNNACENLHLLCPTCHRDSELMWRSNDNYGYGVLRYWNWFFERDYERANLSRQIRLGDAWIFGDPHLLKTHFEAAKKIEKVFRYNIPLLERMASALGFDKWSEILELQDYEKRQFDETEKSFHNKVLSFQLSA